MGTKSKIEDESLFGIKNNLIHCNNFQVGKDLTNSQQLFLFCLFKK